MNYENIMKLVHAHQKRVGCLAFLLARRLGYNNDFCYWIFVAGRYHDIGKLTILDIIVKDGKLTEVEFEKVKNHPFKATQILYTAGFPVEVCDIVLHHHEDYNGKGYPAGLKGEDIPLGSRILRVADVFDALTEERSYKLKMSTIDAIRVMEEMGEVFDLEIFTTLKEEVLYAEGNFYHVSSHVML